jgi:hypothetical protein
VERAVEGQEAAAPAQVGLLGPRTPVPQAVLSAGFREQSGYLRPPDSGYPMSLEIPTGIPAINKTARVWINTTSIPFGNPIGLFFKGSGFSGPDSV